MNKIILLSVLAMFSMSGISEVKGAGKEGNMGIPSGKWWNMPQVAEKLTLTLKEKEELDAMDLKLRRQLIDLKSQVQREWLELEQLFNSSAFNTASSLDHYNKLQEALKKISVERFKFLVRTRELLGLERFQILKTMAQQSRMKRRLKGRSQAQGNNSKR